MGRGIVRAVSTISGIRPVAGAAGVAMALHLAWQFGPGPRLATGIVLIGFLVPLVIVDIEQLLLPDRLTMPFLWTGLAVNLQGLFATLHSAVIGAMAGYFCFRMLLEAYRRLTGRQGLGRGDCKLLAALGAWFGWQMLPAIILATVAGQILFLLALMAAGRAGWRTQVPFGPALAFGGWVALAWGETLPAWLIP